MCTLQIRLHSELVQTFIGRSCLELCDFKVVDISPVSDKPQQGVWSNHPNMPGPCPPGGLIPYTPSEGYRDQPCKPKLQYNDDHSLYIDHHLVKVAEVDYGLDQVSSPEERIIMEYLEHDVGHGHHDVPKHSLFATALSVKNYAAFDLLLNVIQSAHGFVDVNILFDVIEFGEFRLFLELTNNCQKLFHSFPHDLQDAFMPADGSNNATQSNCGGVEYNYENNNDSTDDNGNTPNNPHNDHNNHLNNAIMTTNTVITKQKI